MDDQKLNKYLQMEAKSFVVLGEFIPSLYQPSLLEKKGFISEIDANNAEINEISRATSNFKIAGWLDFFVIRNRIQLLTRQQAYFPLLDDLVVNVFSAISNVVIQAVGINFMYSFKMPDQNAYYNVGDNMVGLEKWKVVFESPKLADVTIRKEIDEKGFTNNVHISPTALNFKIDYGVDVAINYHKTMSNADGKELALFIKNNLDYCKNNSKEIVNNIIKSFF